MTPAAATELRRRGRTHAAPSWVDRISTWWPADHTVSGEPDVTVVLEPRLGGRIYERTASGVEHDWGEVTVWDPPSRLGYLWHLRRDRADATDVLLRFQARGTGTRIDIEHAGWERLGAEAAQWRDRNRGGWESLLPHFRAVVDQTGDDHGRRH